MDEKETTYDTNRILLEEGWYSIQELEQIVKDAKEQKRQMDKLLRNSMQKTR